MAHANCGRRWPIAAVRHYATWKNTRRPEADRMSGASDTSGGARTLAHPNGEGQLQPQRPQQQEWRWTCDGRLEIPDADGRDAQGVIRRGADAQGWQESHERPTRLPNRGIWLDWPPEPDVGRVAHGVAYRVDRITALGNGQVPRVAKTAWRLLSQRRILR